MITETAIDLQKFCGEDVGRLMLASPFVKDGWKYATDCVACIRTRTDEPDTPESPRIPLAHKVFDDAFKPVKTLPWTDFLIVYEMGLCPFCNVSHEVNCERCGKHKCDYCKGADEVLVPVGRKVGENFIAVQFDEKISSLPNVRYVVGSGMDDIRSRPHKPAAFVFDAGDGTTGEGRVIGRQWEESFTLAGKGAAA